MSGFPCKPRLVAGVILLVGAQLACGPAAPTPVSSGVPIPSAGAASRVPPVQPPRTEALSPAPTTQVEPSPTAAARIETQPPTAAKTAAAPLPTIAAGDSTRTLAFDGLERSYLLHVPPGYDPAKPARLVLVYHGLTLDGEQMVRITGMSDVSDQAGFIVAYPNGTGSRRSWNGGACCADALKSAVDDVGFTRALIDELAGMLNLDRKRIYATGFSNGAIMAYRLACDLADQIAAVAPVGAAPAVLSCQPSRPVSVVHFHGDADELNPYEGGMSEGGLKFIPVEMGIEAWVKLNGCQAQAQETASGKIVHRVYAPCQQDSAVELYKVLGGLHAWPGGEAVSAQVGEPTDEIDASALIWEFFSAHPMP